MKKVALLCMALVLALGALGTAYALWYDDLFISGTVTTGTFDVEWSLDGEPYSNETKDVSSEEAYIIDDVLYINIYDAYPCVTYYFPIDIHCLGSVPAHICPLYVYGGNLPADATVTFPDWSGYQLHYCEHAYGVITVHLGNEALQDTVYSFSAYLMAYQYNETPTCLDYVPD